MAPTRQSGSVPRRHLLLVIAVMAVWGFNFVPIHWGLESFSPLLFAALRFTLVAFPACLFIRPPQIHWGYVVGEYIVASSTWQNPTGVMTEVIERAR